MKKIIAALAAFFIALTLVSTPSTAMDRTQHLTGLNPPSTWMNQEQRDVRIGFGALAWNLLAGSNATYAGSYANLAIVPVTGLFVAVGPTTASTVGTLYQFQVDDASGYGGFPSGVGIFLAADPTKILLQGTSFANSANIGPLNPPGSAGQSINYLIEGQVQTADQTSQTVNIVSSGGSVTSTSANRDRVDKIVYQSKAGTAATTGTQTTPTVDAGWVAIGFVAVANGTVTISSGMVSALTGSAISANVQLSPGAQQNGFINVSSSITSGAGVFYAGTPGSASIDYGVTAASTWTASSTFNVPANPLYAKFLVSTPTGIAGYSNPGPSNGDAVIQESASVGRAIFGGATFSGTLDCGLSVATACAFNKPLLATALSNSTTTQAYVLPEYTSAGAADGSTGHMVRGSGTTSSGSVAVTLTNAAVFTNSSSYTCNLTVGGVTPTVTATLSRTSGSAFTIYTSVASNQVDYVCVGS